VHYQNLVGLLLRRALPEADFQVASDGIVGLAQVGQWQPDLLIVDLLLPGIDGAALISSLRSQPMFSAMRLLVITSLAPEELTPYALALDGVPVVHKTQLVTALPPLLVEQAAAAGGGVSDHPGRVLLVEDDAAIRQFVALALEDLTRDRARLRHGR
jgi:DNA-binding response OmpR family regulator